MGPFEFGNTTVRSGSRLRDGLTAIHESNYEGTLRGAEGDLALIQILGAAGVVNIQGDVTRSVGRKWRAAMCKLGFLFDEYQSNQSQIGVVGKVTPNGLRLIMAESLAAQQDCFLRAMAGLNLAFQNRAFKSNPGFSPLKHILEVLFAVEDATGQTSISFIEFASFAQYSPQSMNLEEITNGIRMYRELRGNAENKKRFDSNFLATVVTHHGRVQQSTYIDYADENLRYLKASGLFSSSGRGIKIADTKLEICRTLLSSIHENGDFTEYWQNLTNGAPLPTDDAAIAIETLDTLIATAQARGIPVPDIRGQSANIATLTSARYDLEDRIALDEELDYAQRQASEWQEIAQYLGLLLGRSSPTEDIIIDEEIEIPRGERPAYLEWAVWRAFLAINRICNPPFESRKFDIDRDFKPIHHAPGGGPDLIFEFENYTLIVEVTLLTTDRQASAELVGVQRHVFQIAKDANPDRPVYCLFLAPSITNMVGRDFMRAGYEENDGTYLALTIIPLALSAFMEFFVVMLRTGNPDSSKIRQAIERCSYEAQSVTSTSGWLEAITTVFSQVLIS